MTLNPIESEFEFLPRINWKESITDAFTQDVHLTGVFTASDGRKFEVRVSYNNEALPKDLDSNNLKEKIQDALNEVESDTLATLSGHHIRTNYQELQKKTIHVLKGGQEINDWQDKPLAPAVTKVQEIFSNVFFKLEVKEVEEKEEEEIEAESDIEISFTEISRDPLEAKIPSDLYREIQPNLERIKKLAKEKYLLSDEKLEKLLEAIANSLTKDEDDGLYYVTPSNPNASKMNLRNFLVSIENDLLKIGSLIENCYVEGVLQQLVNTEDNKDTAYVSPDTYLIQEKREDVKRNFTLNPGHAEEIEKVLIPVNLKNNHWMLYCLDVSDKDRPVLYKCDSLPPTKPETLEAIQILETQIVNDLHQHFNLPQQISIRVEDAKVTSQENNNCGVHTCKNAEWFAKKGTFNPDGLEPEDFTKFRMDMLISYLQPRKSS